ncbi:beta-galactosidase [Georgenia sp. M64]|uniref:beta-galactosidase n=1 Tax=Georgenia sp. M64 TaxID=3120520 RepID=UPI0030DE1EC5
MRDDDVLVVRHEGWQGPPVVPAMAGAPDADPRLTVTARGLARDGVGWVPVSGEIHYSRVPRARWRERLLLMRAGGVDVVSTYLIWIHHQGDPGPPRFDGDLDVAAFVRLCHELGLAVVLRIGPWCHGEVRNGGFPDWVQDAPVRHRTDDAGYLALVRPWFEALGEQLAALCAPGGPVLAVQVENELYDQPDHLLTLKSMARSVGLRAPLWTATAWGGALLPPEEVLPLWSGYGDGFWVDAHAPWDPTFRSHYLVSHEWDDPGVGADVRGVAAEEVSPRKLDESFPPATCELGGGMATTYHRRPVPTGADIAAVANTKIAAGSAWQGYYMYAGGTNPAGPAVQESHATGYPNDLPRLDYDFHAAIGSAGLLGPSHAPLRRQHAFLRAFGPQLVGMRSSLPDVLPKGVEDSRTLRWAVRGDGTSGFVVISWHQPHVPLPDLHGVVLALDLPGGRLRVGPFDVPAGTLARWPFGLDVGGIRVGWATASALTLADPSTLVLVAERGVDVDVCLDPAAVVSGALAERAPGVHRARPGGTLEVELDGARARVVVVAAEDADDVWVLQADARPLVTLCADPVWVEGGDVVVRAAVEPRVRVLGEGWESLPVRCEGQPRPPREVRVVLERRPGEVPPGYGRSQGRASAPAQERLTDLAARYRLTDVGTASRGEDRRVLRLVWAGDVAQLIVDDDVVADRFWDGSPWDVDLDVLPGAERDRVSVRILPLHPGAEVWLPAEALDRRRSVAGALEALDAATLTRTSWWRAAVPARRGVPAGR